LAIGEPTCHDSFHRAAQAISSQFRARTWPQLPVNSQVKLWHCGLWQIRL